MSACNLQTSGNIHPEGFDSADTGFTTETTCKLNVSSTCVVLALMVSLAFTLTVSSSRYGCFSAAVESAVLLTKTVNMACEMHVNATLLDCIIYLYDPSI